MSDLDPWAFQRWAYQTRAGSPARKAVLMVLAVMVDTNTGRCEAKQETLAQACETTDRTIRDHLTALEHSGLITRRQQRRGDGRRRADEFLLLAPWIAEWPDGAPVQRPLQPEESSASVLPEPSSGSGHQPEDRRSSNRKQASGQELPLRTTTLREGGSAREPGHEEDATLLPIRGEEAIVAELRPLLDERGQPLTTSDRLHLRSVLRAAPAGLDPVAAAARLRRHYGDSGKAAHRPIGSIGALLAAELSRSTPERELWAVSTGRRRPTARRARGAASARLTPAPAALRINDRMPAGAEPPGARLTAAWDDVRDQLRAAVPASTWSMWLEPLELSGFVTTLVGALGDDDGQPQRVLLLRCPPDKAAWIAGRFGQLIEPIAQAVLGEHVTPELVTDPRSLLSDLSRTARSQEDPCSSRRSSAA